MLYVSLGGDLRDLSALQQAWVRLELALLKDESVKHTKEVKRKEKAA